MLAACASTPPQEPFTAPRDLYRLRNTATVPMHTLTPFKTPTEIPGKSEKKELAKTIREKTQQAIDEDLWEDGNFKAEVYALCRQLNDRDVLTHFRWGMEFMDKKNLKEVLILLDRYN